jgi:hypothetical protein
MYRSPLPPSNDFKQLHLFLTASPLNDFVSATLTLKEENKVWACENRVLKEYLHLRNRKEQEYCETSLRNATTCSVHTSRSFDNIKMNLEMDV